MNFDVVLDSESRNVLEIPCLMISQTGPIGLSCGPVWQSCGPMGAETVRKVLWYDNSVLCCGPTGSRCGPVVLWYDIAGPCWSSVRPVGRQFLVRHNPSRWTIFRYHSWNGLGPITYWCIRSELGQLQSDYFQTEVEADFIVISWTNIVHFHYQVKH
jgi:hypothetical protein